MTRLHRQINLPFPENEYHNIVCSATMFRDFVTNMVKTSPELFPTEIVDDFLLKDRYSSKKMSLVVRRIEIGDTAYTIRPSFVLPYFCVNTDIASNALFLRKFSVPYWALAVAFGKDAMYWYRLENSLGNRSLVGSTLRNQALLPEHINTDEKHTKLGGEKAYIAVTVANGCILGAELSETAGEKDLTKAYGVFKQESQALSPTYSPLTAVMDGWTATKNALQTLFPKIVIIQCFLHIYIKLRDRLKKKLSDLFLMVADKLWHCYQGKTKRIFVQRVRRLYEWAMHQKDLPDVIIHPIKKLRNNIDAFKSAYDFDNAYRTSNMVDRLMQIMDKHLFNCKYFKGKSESARLGMRAWSLIQNFAYYNPITTKKHNGIRSPAEKINGKKYHDDWLQNLLISSSMAGYWSPPQNPI